MTDAELLKVLQGIRNCCDQQMQDLLKLKTAGVDVHSDDGTTLDDMIQREYDATQQIERAMASVRSRIA